MNSAKRPTSRAPSEPKLKLYIGCSLTHAPQPFRAAVADLKDKLRAKYDVFDFLGMEKGTAADVYTWDIGRCVATCDLFVAICDHTSLGLGYEIGTAVERFHKPVLAVAGKHTHLSRLIVGIDAPNYSLQRYGEFSEIAGLIDTFAANGF